ncbi:MAG: AsmA-like C-terminal region-containing protein, partial [Vicinamibacterales bacterium]
AFAGTPDTISGRLSGRIDLAGEGMEAGAVGRTTRGTVRVDIADGIVRRLGLLRAVVVATAMRANASPTSAIGETDEPFSNLGATLTVENGVARTSDLTFESDDVSLTAQGSVELDGDPITLTGRIQLSEQLTKEGGTDLARYTQEQGRVTLPVAITGSADGLSVSIGVGEMMQRAIRNRATEETQRAIQRGLGGLFR